MPGLRFADLPGPQAADSAAAPAASGNYDHRHEREFPQYQRRSGIAGASARGDRKNPGRALRTEVFDRREVVLSD